MARRQRWIVRQTTATPLHPACPPSLSTSTSAPCAGRHVEIVVVSKEFEGKSAVNRQRMVYKVRGRSVAGGVWRRVMGEGPGVGRRRRWFMGEGQSVGGWQATLAGAPPCWPPFNPKRALALVHLAPKRSLPPCNAGDLGGAAGDGARCGCHGDAHARGGGHVRRHCRASGSTAAPICAPFVAAHCLPLLPPLPSLPSPPLPLPPCCSAHCHPCCNTSMCILSITSALITAAEGKHRRKRSCLCAGQVVLQASEAAKLHRPV